jgi:hypothetical protein
MTTTPTTIQRHLGRVLSMITATGALAILALGLVTPPALADNCANATQREHNNSIDLPDCRAYEMVTPPYKQGFGVIPTAFTDDGLVAYTSPGTFAGNGFGGLAVNPYLGVRTPVGWETQARYPPAYNLVAEATLLASDLRSSVTALSDPRDQSGSGAGFYVRDFNGGVTRVGQGPIPGDGNAPDYDPFPVLASDDLTHLVYNRAPGQGGDSIAALWEYAGVGGAAVARRVSVDNHGDWVPGEACGREILGGGRVVVFGSSTCAGGRVWARVGGSATVAVSGSECARGPSDLGGLCNDSSPATYEGGAEDGSRLFITTDQQLVDSDRDLTRDLYACDIPTGSPAPVGDANRCAALTKISGASDGAEVEGVAAASDDWSQVYFVARNVLADNIGAGGSGALAAAQNLYLWVKDAAHPAGQTRFVARVDGGMAGGRISGGGRYLVFSTPAALVGSGPGADEDGAADVYRYDTESETMLRLSTSVTGGGGNTPLDASGPAVSADGSMVVFETAEALSPNDTDGVSDVYLWREGRVSRISRGGAQIVGISSTGQDIYFETDQRLVAADGDVNTDVYDARVGGGFALSGPASCSGVACQGPSSAPPGVAAPSPSTGGPGDDGAGVVPVVSLRSVSAAARKRLAATGRLTVTVSANTAGVVRVAATATLAGKLSTVVSGRRTLAKPGTARIALTLSKKARQQLATRGRLAVRLTVSHSKVALGRSVTLRLTHAKAKGSRS